MNKKLQKVISVTTSVTTIVWLSGIAALAPMSAMATTINEGDTIKVADNPDVYIAKYVGSKKFKRLILSPTVFNSYGHLSWSKIKTVTQAELDAFTTSDLVRAVGDPKVYKLTPNGDDGSKQWINMTAEAFTSGGWDWDSIYEINTVDRDNYSAAAADIIGGTPSAPVTGSAPSTPATGNVSVSLASDTPAAGVAVASAARVPFTKVNFTAGATAAAITSLTVQRTGLADDAALASLTLIDASDNSQIGLNQTLNSAHQVVFNETLTIPANTTKTYILAANMPPLATAALYAGQIASLSLVSVTSAGTVSGSLPITGNGQTINGTLTIGTATAAGGSLDPGADTTTKEIGTTGFKFSGIRITAGSAEDITVYSIRWNQAGSAGASDLANVKVSDGTTDYATTVSSDGKYYTSTFGTGIVIGKGLNKEFTLKGDIVSGSGRSVDFNIYRTTDIVVKGNTYGYYLTPTSAGTGRWSNTTNPFYNAYQVTSIGGGTMRVDKATAGAPSSNITEGATGQILGAFDVVVAGETVNATGIVLDVEHTGIGSSSDITSVSMYKEDGTALATAGTATDDNTTVHDTLNGGVDGHFVFSGTVSFPVGTTKVIIKGNLNTDFATNDTFRVGFSAVDSRNFPTNTGAITGNTIAATPAAAVWGNTMTVKGGALIVNVSATPVAQAVIRGTQNFTFANYIFDATASGEDVRVTLVTLRHQSSAQEVNTCFLYDGQTQLNTTAVNTTYTVGDDEIAFTLDNPLVITKGSQKTVALKCNIIATASASNSSTWGMSTNAAITATGVSTGNNIDEVVPGGAGQQMSFDSAGQYSVTLDSSTPASKLAAANTTGNVITTLRFKATAEQISVDKITLALYSPSSTTRDLTSIGIYDGSTPLVTGFLGVGNATGLTSANATTTFTLSTPLVIPANQEKVVTIKADIAPITQDNTVATAGHRIIIAYYDTDSDTTNGGTGASGTRIAGFSAYTGAGHIPGNSTYIYKSVPTVSSVALASTKLAAGNGLALFKFKVAADVKGDIDLYKVTFRISTTSTATMYINNLTLYDVTDAAEVEVGDTDSADVVSNSTDQNVILELNETDTPRTIAANSYRTFELRGDVSGSVSSGSTCSTTLMGDAQFPAIVTTHMTTAQGVDDETGSHDDFIWSDWSAAGHSVNTSDWTNGYLVSGLPSSSMSAVVLSY